MSSFNCLIPLVAVHFWSVFGQFSTQTDVCIWNVVISNDGQGSSYTKINGLYELQEEKVSNRPVYLNNDTGCVVTGIYLYWKTQTWVIGDDPANSDLNTVTGAIGRCVTNVITVSDPTGCSDAWQIPADPNNSTADIDPKIEAILGSRCPSWNADCTELSITISPASNDDCDGTFTYDASAGYDNVYSKEVDSTTTVYWYFNFHSFQWVCATAVEMDTCTVSGALQKSYPNKHWQDIDTSASGVITVDLESSAAAQVTCTVTANPSPAPTKGPLPPGDDGVGGPRNAVYGVYVYVSVMFIYAANAL